MKKLFFTLLPVFVISATSAQDSTRFTVSGLFSDDVEWLLETENIHTYAVDLAPVKGEDYKLKIYIDEYRNGRDSVKQVHNQGYQTRRSFTDGPTYQMERLRTFFKVQNDSIGQLGVSIPGFFSFRRPVDLHPVNGRTQYNARPFAPCEFETGKKIPLVLYGSFWYDERFDITRFCGSNELPVDMDDEMFDLIPHYFILSLKVEKNKSK